MSSGNCISPKLGLLPNSVVSIDPIRVSVTLRALIRILVIFQCTIKVLLSNSDVCGQSIDAYSVLGASATGAGVKYLFSLRSFLLSLICV